MPRVAIILAFVGVLLITVGGFSHTMNAIGGGGIFLMVVCILWLLGKIGKK
jgi:hypothetical protein